MNIVMVIGSMELGGAERVMSNLANNLVNEHDVTLITVLNRDVKYKLSPKINLINGLNYSSKLNAAKIFRKKVLDIKPDVVLSFLSHINIFTISSLAGTGIPIVVSERNDPKFEPSGLIRKVLRKITFPFAKGYVFQTNEAQDYFSKKIIKSSIIIPNPIFMDSKLIGSANEMNLEIVTVGRLTQQKNQKMLIDAFFQIHQSFPDYVLKIYGEGELQNFLDEYIKEIGLQEKIFLMGTRENIFDEIKNCSTFVMTSNNEGMPNALMEAMSLGICCISTDCPCGGPKYLINDGENGYLVPVGDTEELKNKLIHVLLDEKLRKQIGKNASKIYETLNPPRIFKEWESYLLKIAKAR